MTDDFWEMFALGMLAAIAAVLIALASELVLPGTWS